MQELPESEVSRKLIDFLNNARCTKRTENGKWGSEIIRNMMGTVIQ